MFVSVCASPDSARDELDDGPHAYDSGLIRLSISGWSSVVDLACFKQAFWNV